MGRAALAREVPAERLAAVREGFRLGAEQRLDEVALPGQANAVVAADLCRLMCALSGRAQQDQLRPLCGAHFVVGQHSVPKTIATDSRMRCSSSDDGSVTRSPAAFMRTNRSPYQPTPILSMALERESPPLA